MARASTTSDAFNAVAEPRRREILSYLAGTERPVGAIVAALGVPQPSISKHLRVLHDVGTGSDSRVASAPAKAVPDQRRSDTSSA